MLILSFELSLCSFWYDLNGFNIFEESEFYPKNSSTASPYGCSDNLDDIGDLQSLQCNNVNEMIHFFQYKDVSVAMDICHIINPVYTMSRLINLTLFKNKRLGLHDINIKLYSVPLKCLNNMIKNVKKIPIFNSLTIFNSPTPKYKLGSVIMDIANHGLFEPPRIEEHA